MSLNFAPYQSSPPESTRALSPPPRSATASPSHPVRTSLDRSRPSARRQPAIASIADQSDPWATSRNALPSPSTFADDPGRSGGYQDIEGQRGRSDGGGGYFNGRGGAEATGLGGGGVGAVFETSLGFRMDWEAVLAYVLLPPAGGVILLIFEHKSDYVRFHAWQSALVFSAAFVLHLIFSWSKVLSWIIFVGDIALIAYCAYHAYRDAETLDRLELPVFGRLASNFVDSE